MTPTPYVTTMRLSQEELDLLDAWAKYQHAMGRIPRASRTHIIQRLLEKIPPPKDDLPTAKAVREAYAALFGAPE